MNFGAKSDVIHDENQQTIICVSFSGEYPPGSAGTDIAAAMKATLAQAVWDHKPQGVILDCSNLQYVMGNGIVMIIEPLCFKAPKEYLPFNFVAQGETAKALMPLMDSQKMFFGILGAQLFPTKEEALGNLIAKLN